MTPTTEVTIRPFEERDYVAALELNRRVYPDYERSLESWRRDDETRRKDLHHARFVAEQGGRIVGMAETGHSEGMYHPRRFGLDLMVDPDCQSRGIGRALYARILENLAPFDPLSIRSGAREDYTKLVQFFRSRGYQEIMRAWESRLDVPAFDFAPWGDWEAPLREHGVEIRTLRELMAEDPEHRRKLYELDEACSADVPHPEPRTPISFERFEQHIFESPDLIPEAFLVAVAGGEYVALSTLWKGKDDRDIHNGLTGTRREWRRKGIALALKLRNVRWAQQHGVPTIKTWNESNNRAMLGINERMGFVKQPAWITFSLHLKDEG
ncbi:GNAT superfamily N-acetyltransferase [Deinobacterium chartae]|uniref:GNAT superfamily N-acetyltransferase n=1 Tax=Deinobacterium chartae TaxID=521158 RepID=A0A841HVF8_9DEIO|nr:GNAT family N-acetyltransferase [Deinobacterium chartae]MBB6097481.1 GNAT superfamily N-acetyltransferase [Deinobacterium chartae]